VGRQWRISNYCQDFMRALGGVALGSGNDLFMGSDAGGERAASVYSLVETAKLSGLDPWA
jgi:transposase